MPKSDIASNRLTPEEYQSAFDQDSKLPLDDRTAPIQASRCYFCYDAPCVEACPTKIDIPSFIRKIFTGNLNGAALDILQPNIFGGMCARVCPVEELCEEACVRTAQEDKPVLIGLLQRYATDSLLEKNIQPFKQGPKTNKNIAVVGGGPAGLSCAHALAKKGHSITVFEEQPKLSGLNEYGIAAYKVPNDFAQREINFILGIGGIEVQVGKALGREFTLTSLKKTYGAVFVATGQSSTHFLGIEGSNLKGISPAVEYISELRQTKDKSILPVGRKVVVVGGGNTAIDIAVQMKRLGAEDVTIVYRRGFNDMSATIHEKQFAQKNGVKIKCWGTPKRFIGSNGHVNEAEFMYTQKTAGKDLSSMDNTFTLLADQVFLAIGQHTNTDPLLKELEVEKGRIVVQKDQATSVPGIFAGGDCVEGPDLTVQAVQDGKVAAEAIDRYVSIAQKN